MRIIGIAGGAMVLIIFCAGCGSKATPKAASAPQSEQQAQAHQPSTSTNPTEFNADSIQQGKALYESADCVLCHGKAGDGKTYYANEAHMNVHNWHDAEYNKSFSDGQFYDILAKGKGSMPAYGGRTPAQQMWLMVDYIRSFGMK